MYMYMYFIYNSNRIATLPFSLLKELLRWSESDNDEWRSLSERPSCNSVDLVEFISEGKEISKHIVSCKNTFLCFSMFALRIPSIVAPNHKLSCHVRNETHNHTCTCTCMKWNTQSHIYTYMYMYIVVHEWTATCTCMKMKHTIMYMYCNFQDIIIIKIIVKLITFLKISSY